MKRTPEEIIAELRAHQATTLSLAAQWRDAQGPYAAQYTQEHREERAAEFERTARDELARMVREALTDQLNEVHGHYREALKRERVLLAVEPDQAPMLTYLATVTQATVASAQT